jgi:4-hydroxyphenylpyruvate dioxygenase-like putative hemolysin
MGGIHHLAYESDDIEWDIKRWKKYGIEFSTDDIIECPDDDLRQIFTKPLPAIGNIILELIQRGDKGFCGDSVKRIMESTKT